MRTKVLTMSLLAMGLLAVFCLSGCEKKQNEKEKTVTPPYAVISIMKLKQPDYKPYIIAYYPEGISDSIYAVRSNKYGEPVGKSGYSPYWDLKDGWLLVDWKWGPTFPYWEGAVLLTEEPWGNLTHLLQTWPKETPHISDPIAEHYYVQASKLAAYCNKSYDDILNYIDNPLSMDFDPAVHIDLLDSIWTILQKDLSAVIANGDLAKITQDQLTDD